MQGLRHKPVRQMTPLAHLLLEDDAPSRQRSDSAGRQAQKPTRPQPKCVLLAMTSAATRVAVETNPCRCGAQRVTRGSEYCFGTSHPKFEDRGFAAVRHYSRPPIFSGFSLAAVRLCPAPFAWVGVRVGVNSVQMASGLAIRDALFSPVHGCSQLPQNAGFWSSPVHGRSLVATAVGVRVSVCMVYLLGVQLFGNILTSAIAMFEPIFLQYWHSFCQELREIY